MAKGPGAVSRCGEDGGFVVRPASFRRTLTGVNWSRFGVAGCSALSHKREGDVYAMTARSGKDVSQRPAFLWALFPTLALFLSATSISDAQVGTSITPTAGAITLGTGLGSGLVSGGRSGGVGAWQTLVA